MMAINALQVRYNELLAFVQYWIPKYGECDLFLYGQAAPRQNIPYVTVNIMSNVETIGTVERRLDPDGQERIRTQLQVVVDLFAFSNESDRYANGISMNNAYTILQELKTSLRYPDVYNRLSDITCRLVAEDTVVDSTQILSTTFEPQATCSLTFSTVIESLIDNGAIENIGAQGSMTPVVGSIGTINVDILVTE